MERERKRKGKKREKIGNESAKKKQVKTLAYAHA